MAYWKKKAQGHLLLPLYEAILDIKCELFEDYFQINLGYDIPKRKKFVCEQSYKIKTRHPDSGGSTTGWIENLFKKESRIIAGDYDILVFGHFHRKLIHKRSYLKMDGELYTKWDCISGHFLKYHKGYAHRKLLTPHEPGCIIATFYRDEHKIEVEEF